METAMLFFNDSFLPQIRDILDILLGLALGIGVRRKIGITVFLQVALLLVRMARHYYDTHPQGKRLGAKNDEKSDKLFEELAPVEHKFLTAADTGARG